jgi:hypothetical protein
MTTTVDQQTALEGAVVAWAYFVELHFLSGIQRYCNFNKTIPWDGYDWLGLGALVNISEIKSSEKIEPNAVTFALNVAQTAIRDFAVGSVEEYRGRPIAVYQCPLTPQHTLIDDPILAWEGDMDIVAVSVEGDGGESSGSVSLRCEPSAKRLRRRNALRVNSAQQKLRHPGDTGFDFQADLLANPQTWLSIRFQTI